ncbi:MAG: chemotaxis protein [Syntrophobacterales bacterium CG_4_8_14_3_um_filter_58_8]|nr:MAG: chemotaxis protein [Syntrophaceae bacterium CG2_30_58_14]PIV05363.1 MAG: chemotaxis protein [Syntrophobacterales bacterium CG03_land_8_20_14_0_80_58_14]PJC71921.1 MAG: chemotaxis protein [Syntrophobacterales bacterium CG_4_8_14_3_um_filter_58_8]
MEDNSKILIRRRKKKSHDEHHGGSWKVAYADFVTSMMAFFLLLWLLAMVAPEKRAAVSEYFSNFSLFDSQSQQSGASILNKSAGVLEIGRPKPKESFPLKEGKKTTPQELAKMMRMAIDDKLQAMKNQVLIDTTPEGLRIQIVDNEGSDIFRLGSDEPTEKAVQIIRLVSENIREKPNRIVIEGHTDSAPFKTVQKTNWELSTSRASAARRELENNGVDPGRIARVVGYADQELLVREDPKDPRNRRISIILLQ